MTLFTNLVFKMVAFSLLFKIPTPKSKKTKKDLFNSTQYKGTSTIKSRNKLSQYNTLQITAPGDQKSITVKTTFSPPPPSPHKSLKRGAARVTCLLRRH
jgi:hypothetical protein